MKIILVQDVKKLGKKGDVVEASEGYARNFLLPQKMGKIATPGELRLAEEGKKREKSALEERRKKDLERAEKIKKLQLTLKKEEKNGRLFGSVLAKEISAEAKKNGLEISPDSVIMNEAIRKLGKYKIQIAVSKEISADLELEVIGK